MATSNERTNETRISRPFAFIHIGDLHLTHLDAKAEPALHDREQRLEADLTAILAQIDAIRQRDGFDFVYLPGDLAENGLKAEYEILEKALRHHPDLPVRLIPGDHDRQLGNMTAFEAFRSGLRGQQNQPDPVKGVVAGLPTADHLIPEPIDVTQYYYAETHSGVLCLFVDVVSAGYGQKGIGLDFRLGTPVSGEDSQIDWLAKEIMAAQKDKTPCAAFMHAYPADFRSDEEAAAVAGLFWNGGVRVVEMGHTHYNELAPDGRTLYGAVRSTGQNEDGPTGYAVCAIDGAATSWRFKQVQQTWPFVLITSPADHRLATEALSFDAHGYVTVRALVFSDRPPDETTCHCRVDDGAWLTMPYRPHSGVFELAVEWPEGSRRISVKAADDREFGKDFVDVDTIEPAAIAARFVTRTMPDRPGSDAQKIDVWSQKGIRGDQLGPNKHGRKW